MTSIKNMIRLAMQETWAEMAPLFERKLEALWNAEQARTKGVTTKTTKKNKTEKPENTEALMSLMERAATAAGGPTPRKELI
jgi:hypothetical protein